MLVAIIAAAALGVPLNVELACSGEYRESESDSVDQDAYGRPLSQPLSIDTTVRRQGVARIGLHGDAGRLVYPDGRERQLKLLEQDDEKLIAQYERQILFVHLTGRVQINRITGEVRVTGGSGGRPTAFERKF
jgi:hypothetical protein